MSGDAMTTPGHPEAAPGGRPHRVRPANPFTRFPAEAIEQSIPARFEQQAARCPGRLAIATGTQQLDYATLNQAANRVAQAVLDRRGEAWEPVAVLLDHGAPLIAAILGVLKAGKAYVPLDPTYPEARIAYMLEDSGAELLVANGRNLGLASRLATRARMLDADELDPAEASGNPGLAVSPGSPAYILYTSGSTGQPKGVLQTHRNVLHETMNFTNGIHISEDDRLVLVSSCSFGDAVRTLYGALLNGASLHPLDIRAEGLAPLAGWLVRQQVTVYRSVVTVFRHFVGGLTGDEAFPEIRLVYLAGEPVYRRDVDLFRERFASDCILVNGLGSGESFTYRWFFLDRDTPVPGNNVPVGYPLEGKQTLLLDEGGREAGPGQPGEIAVRSRYLSPGYWRREDETRARFLPDPEGGDERVYVTGDMGRMLPDGCLVHLGRKDFQVKIRGHRIETGEIEMALTALEGVREAAVVAREDRSGDQGLVAYLVVTGQQAPTVGELRRGLARSLPDYMVPGAYVVLGDLPRTATGKLDRRSLPEPDGSRPRLDTSFAAPRTPVEERLAALWAEVLGVSPIGVHDSFLDLGGHSLKATRLASRMRGAFGVDLPLARVFAEPTVGAQALAIVEKLAEGMGLDERAHLLDGLEDADAPGSPETVRQAMDRIARPRPEAAGAKPEGSLASVSPASLRPPAFGIPPSFAQQRLWFLHWLAPESPAYNMHVAARLGGQLDAAALERSLGEIVRRHEALRTTFDEVDGLPVQVVAPSLALSLKTVDIGRVPEAEREAEARRLAGEEACVKPFALARGPLLRAMLLRLGPQDHVFVLTLHHIITDGWSMGVLFRELSALYEAFAAGRPSPLHELPMQYADFARRQRAEDGRLEAQLAWWKRQLAGLSRLELPADLPRPPVQTARGAQVPVTLSEAVSEGLRRLARQEGATLFMTLLAAVKVLLHRLTGQTDVAVGSPVAGRPLAETEELIGLFLNTLVLRTDLSGDPTFRELLARVRTVAVAAYDHQDLPFERLVEELRPPRDLGRTPLFQVFVNLHDPEGAAVELHGLRAEEFPLGEPASRFDLTVYASDRGPWVRIDLVYNADLFLPDRMACLGQQLRHLLEQVVAEPDARVRSYSLVTPESRPLLPDPREPLAEPRHEPVTAALAAWVERAPGRIAVTQAARSWTYAELAERTNALARMLLANGLERGDVVAVQGPRSFGLIAAMAAAFASGGVLLPIDGNLPPQRQQLMLQEAEAKWLLDAEGRVAKAEGRRDEAGGRRSEAPILPKVSNLREVSPDDPAYIFFTSGTTGVPKGVLGCHKGLSHFLAWEREAFAIGPEDRVAQLTGLSFDAVLRDIFLPLTSGGTLCLPERLDGLGPDDALRWLDREGITVLHTVPSVAAFWLASRPRGGGVALRSLRWTLFAGEPLTEALVREWRAAFPESGEIVNLYGPTETTLVKCFYRVPADPHPGIQPLGRPLPQTQALVLRDDGQPCGVGEPGEIVLRTPFGTLGYVNAPEEARRCFVRNPFRDDGRDKLYFTGDGGRVRADGVLEFLGRLDDQVKIRGVRIEPAEVAAVLARHPAVMACAVVARKDRDGEPCLVAFVVAAGGRGRAPEGATARELRSHLIGQLPAAMVPAAFVFLDRLPRTPNGKVDRSALPPHEAARPEDERPFTEPRTPVERALGHVWAEVLGMERVGVCDNFFELGGHSLKATRLLARVRTAFGVELPLAGLFAAPTIEGQALALVGALMARTATGETTGQWQTTT